MSQQSQARFAEVWRLADRIGGWLTEDQARLLWTEAMAAPAPATVLEIGSHQGRSTVVLGSAVAPSGGRVVAMDPFVEGPLFGGLSTKEKFEASIDRAGLGGTVELVQEYSTRARPSWSTPIDLLYVDGKHDYWTVSDDLLWADHLRDGGAVLIHDCFSSIGVTLGVLHRVLPRHTLRYVGREGSLALFRKAPPSPADRLRILREMPWWLRNVGIKVLLRLRLRGVARLFGHDSPYDPY